MYDGISPLEPIDSFKFSELASQSINKSSFSIVEGGSPFYVKHLLDSLPEIDALNIFLFSSDKVRLNRSLDKRTEMMIIKNFPSFFNEITQYSNILEQSGKSISECKLLPLTQAFGFLETLCFSLALQKSSQIMSLKRIMPSIKS